MKRRVGFAFAWRASSLSRGSTQGGREGAGGSEPWWSAHSLDPGLGSVSEPEPSSFQAPRSDLDVFLIQTLRIWFVELTLSV